MKIAFYKGPTNIYGKLIKLWTGGPYCHCEILLDDYTFSATEGVGVISQKDVLRHPDHWTYVNIDADESEMLYLWNWCSLEVGSGYDWKGIWLSQVLFLNRQDPDKWFCSEFCAAAMKMIGRLKEYKAHTLSPNGLYRVLKTAGY